MEKIALIGSAALGFMFGAVYGAVLRMVVRVTKAVLTANQRLSQAESKVKTTQTAEKFPEKVKLPARIK